MANNLVNEASVYVADWRLIDSDGDGLFDYFSDYYSMDNATIFDANPSNNYAGRSILLYFNRMPNAFNSIKKTRLII